MFLILIILSFGSMNLAQENYLVDLKLTLREEKIPAVLNFLLNNSLESTQITTGDIIQLSKLDRMDENDLVEVFKFYNISEVYTIDNLEALLVALNVTFGDFYKALTRNLDLDTVRQQNILTCLNIAPTFWMSLALDSSDIYNILRNGTYNEDTISQAFTASGKTPSEAFTASRNIIKQRVEEKSSEEFMSLLKSLGWNQKAALNFYKALNLTTRDVYEVEKFREIFTNISNSLNIFTTLGIFIAEDKIAVHKFAYQNLLELVDVSHVKIQADQNEIIFRRIEDLGQNIVALASVQPRSEYIEIVERYDSSENCTYATISNGIISTIDVEVGDFAIDKTPETKFLLGAPLICDDSLYALAREENETAIFFDNFYTENSPKPVNIDPIFEDNSSSLIAPIFNVILFLNLFNFVLS